jgi:hypothetical protein
VTEFGKHEGFGTEGDDGVVLTETGTFRAGVAEVLIDLRDEY